MFCNKNKSTLFFFIIIIILVINTSIHKYIQNKTKKYILNKKNKYYNLKIIHLFNNISIYTNIHNITDDVLQEIQEGFKQCTTSGKIKYNSNKNINTNTTNQNKIHYDTRAHIEKHALSLQQCNELVNLAKEFAFEKYEEPVDGKPVYQLDILTSGNKINYPKLWNKIKSIYYNQVKLILHNTDWIQNYKLDFVFLKRYLPTERKYLGIHMDSNFFTVTYLLTDNSLYEGGEFFMYTQKDTLKLEKKIDNYSPKRKDKFVNKHRKKSILPIIANYQIGDAMVFSGEDHYHGILPVTSGERYVLIFFFDRNFS